MLAVIGGSGWETFEGFETNTSRSVQTRYGETSAALALGVLRQGERASEQLYFLPRHGEAHKIPPHKINYRANIDALAQAGVTQVIALNTVGACNTHWAPGELVLPVQVIDYSYGRAHTFFDTLDDFSGHVDFSEPLQSDLREPLRAVAQSLGITVHDGGTYGCTQGPRFETAAEIRRLQRDGCDLVGMTLMPEAALCRERGIQYLSLCLVVNPAAGVTENALDLPDIEKAMQLAAGRAHRLLSSLLLSRN
ncbi:MAG: S-methyl-5'-thioinosine phosphorylase [Pseudomonadales bacterium]